MSQQLTKQTCWHTCCSWKLFLHPIWLRLGWLLQPCPVILPISFVMNMFAIAVFCVRRGDGHSCHVYMTTISVVDNVTTTNTVAGNYTYSPLLDDPWVFGFKYELAKCIAANYYMSIFAPNFPQVHPKGTHSLIINIVPGNCLVHQAADIAWTKVDEEQWRHEVLLRHNQLHTHQCELLAHKGLVQVPWWWLM